MVQLPDLGIVLATDNKFSGLPNLAQLSVSLLSLCGHALASNFILPFADLGKRPESTILKYLLILHPHPFSYFSASPFILWVRFYSGVLF